MDTKIDEGVFIRKGKWGYRLIHPIRNEDKSINWFNLITGGSWEGFIKTSFLVIILVASIFLYKHDIASITAYYQELCSRGIQMLPIVN